MTLTVKPTEPDAAGHLIYTRIGSTSGAYATTGRFWFSVKVTNDSPDEALHINRVQATLLTGVFATVHPFDRDIPLPAGESTTVDLAASEVISFDSPAPDTVVISVFCDLYPEPKTFQRPLAPYVAPVPGGQYLYPAEEGDIGPDEYFGGGTHEPPDSQGWGTDWRVYRIDANGAELDYRAGGSNSVNADALGWGVPIRAIATGTVLRATADYVNNPRPGERAFQLMQQYDGEQIADVKTTTLSSTRAATLQRLPSGQVQLSVWDITDVGRQIVRLGSDAVVPGEDVSAMAIDALGSTRVIGLLRLSGTNNLRIVVWDIADEPFAITRRPHSESGGVTEVALMTMDEATDRVAFAVRDEAGTLGVSVWEVDANGAVQPRASDTAEAATSVCISALSATRFAASFRTAGGLLKNIVWDFTTQGGYALDRQGQRSADAITRVVTSVAVSEKWTRNQWVTAFRTDPGGQLKLIRWDASVSGNTLTPELETLTNVAIQDTSLALAPASGADGADNVATASILGGSTFKINGWGDPDTLPGTYLYSAQETAGTVSRVSLDELSGADFVVAARTFGGALKLMTWHWAGGGGNAVYVLHGNCRVLYAHFQAGSVDPNMLYPGATVSAGQILGRMGNSGASGDVHTHIHADRISDPLPTIEALLALEAAGDIKTKLIGSRPLPFHQARAMRLSWIVRGGESHPANEFTTLSGHGTYSPALGIRPRLNTRYVDPAAFANIPNGRKEGVPGGTGGPAASIAQGLALSPSGARLYIRGGSYQENLTFTTPMLIRRYDYLGGSSVILQRP